MFNPDSVEALAPKKYASTALKLPYGARTIKLRRPKLIM